MSGAPERLLGLVVSSCGGVEARLCAELVGPAARRGWRLAVTVTPTAARWLDSTGELDRLRGWTDLPVRSTSRLPGEPRPHPDPDVFLFAPASAGSVAKLALGLADNQALTVLGDVLGDPSVTMVVGYQVQDGRVRHPAWQGHLNALESAGVHTQRLRFDQPWTGILDRLPA